MFYPLPCQLSDHFYSPCKGKVDRLFLALSGRLDSGVPAKFYPGRQRVRHNAPTFQAELPTLQNDHFMAVRSIASMGSLSGALILFY